MNWLNGKKVYIFCWVVITSVPLVHFFLHRLSFEFVFFMETLYGYFLLNRSTQAKIHGHKLKDYL